ncbi:MAG: S8 family serine peptidase [Phycisphaerae bacterium]|nr:S8 family serine peptidase [Phycisphaerae bacterium]MDW8261688.1 S8 family serine peptidase [Phycisphaerales bacterium]
MSLPARFEPLEIRKLLSAEPAVQVESLSWGDYTGPVLPDRWIVKLGGYHGTAGSQLKKARRLLGEAAEGVEVRQYLLERGLFSIQLHGVQTAKEQYELLRRLPGFVGASPDWVMTTSLIPNDPFFSNLTNMQNGSNTDVDAPEAWDFGTGSMQQIISIVDSGVDYVHRDLAPNIFINEDEIPPAIRSLLVDTDGDGILTFRDLNNPANIGPGKITDLNGNGRIDGGDVLHNSSGWEDGIDNDGNNLADDLIGWNFLSGNNDPMDVFGHGTHVAGTAAAVGNNSLDVVGINWRARILPMKTGGINGSDNTINTSAAIAAINYSVSLRNRGLALRSINASWGGGGFDSNLLNAITNAHHAGTMFVAAAGNGGSDGIGDDNDAVPHYPSSYNVPNVIAVLNTTTAGGRNSSSNYGRNSVHLGAPGTSILSTSPGNNVSFSTGTSMAAPLVAGTVSLLYSRMPNLTIQQAKTAILETVTPVASLANITVSGGRLNAFRAITAYDIPAPAAPDLDPASDTGVSNSDRITADTTPTFTGVTQPNYIVQVFRNGTSVGTTTANASGHWSFTLPTLADGVHNVSIRVGNGVLISFRSPETSVRIDTTPPVASNRNIPHLLAPQRISQNFNEPMETSFNINDVVITNITTSQVIPPAATVFDYDAPTNRVDIRFPGMPGAIVPDGNYTVSVRSTDPAGNLMPAPYNFSFFILYGDANRNRTVDLADFAPMASNFGQSPRSFAQGDFNFDTTVDLADFALLASNFNRTLPAPSDLPRAQGLFSSQPVTSPRPHQTHSDWDELLAASNA